MKKCCASLVRLPKVEYISDYSVLSLKEQKDFINAIQKHKFKCLFLMALGTGLREGELLALKWNDIDLQEGTVSVNKSIKRVPNINPDGSRTYKLIEQSPKSKRPNRNFQSVLKSLGITPIKFHSLRHTYATRLFEQNVPIKIVQKLMGHKDSNTTLDIYTHVMPEEKIKAVDKINNLLSV